MATNRPMSPVQDIHQLIDEYADDIFRFAFHSVGNHADAKDIVQETFLRAYQALDSFRGDASIKTWLFRIARNLVKDFYRRKSVRDKYLEHSQGAQDRERLTVISTASIQTDEPVPIEDVMDLRQALTRLKQEHRQVLVLRFLEDMSVKESAQALGWSQARLRTTQHRALKQLRAALVENGGYEAFIDNLEKGR